MATPTTGTVQPDGAKKVFPPFDSSTFAPQLIWFALAFGVIYWLSAKVILPRLAGILADRKARIDRDLDDAAKAKTRAEDALTAYEKALGDARARGQTIAQDTRDKVAAESDAKRKALEGDLAGKLAAAEKRVAEMKAGALANVGQIAEEATSAIVQQLIGKTPGASAVASAVGAAVKG
jgi:F-type H+-transporting ATPase subunit b